MKKTLILLRCVFLGKKLIFRVVGTTYVREALTLAYCILLIVERSVSRNTKIKY